MKKIILVPVKNEEWILDKFLRISSLFADHIIIADQNSTDRSVEIAKKYDKVILVSNENNQYNEAQRQILLIEKARELFGLGNFLLAIDADEIISADSLLAKGWQKIEEAPVGTVFMFDKPTPLFDKPKALRYKKGFPLGYKDDGAPHSASLIHSTRIPTPAHAPRVIIDDILFLHLCFVRKNIQFTKNRYYCVLENIKNNRSLRRRRLMYNYYKPEDYEKGDITPIDKNWYNAYDKIGVDLRKFDQQEFYYMDFEVLKIFHQHGTKRFYNDPVWHFDWEGSRQAGLKMGIDGLPDKPIKQPPSARVLIVDFFYKLINTITEKVRSVRTLNS